MPEPSNGTTARWGVGLAITVILALIAAAAHDRNTIVAQVASNTSVLAIQGESIIALKDIAENTQETDEAILKELKAIRIGLATAGMKIEVER
jgi:hypothetical protein